MTDGTWNNAWGDPADYNALPQQELGGFKIGDRVTVHEDVDDDEGSAVYEGDEGTVVGVFHTGVGLFRAVAITGLLVLWDDFPDGPRGINPDLLAKI